MEGEANSVEQFVQTRGVFEHAPLNSPHKIDDALANYGVAGGSQARWLSANSSFRRAIAASVSERIAAFSMASPRGESEGAGNRGA